MKTRLMSTAFLFNDDRILMLKRAENRKLAPGLWTGIGGHLEPEEIDNPRQACIREMYEETGIEKVELTKLELKYILIRLKGTEIRQQFVYFGETHKEKVIQTTEGDLHWIQTEMVMSLEMPWTIEAMLTHYFEIGMHEEEAYVGVLTLNHTPEMKWTKLLDPKTV